MQQFYSHSIQSEAGSYAFLSHKPGSKPGSRNNSAKTRFSGMPKGSGGASSQFRQPLPHLPRTSSGLSSENRSRSPCQICKREGHQALDCFNRMNYSFQGRHPPTELAAIVAESNTTYLNQNQWYADSGANLHVTSDVTNLASSQPYEGDDSVGVGNGTGLPISCIGNASIKTLSSTLALNNIAYCPQASANLLSINKFCIDNNVMFELTGSDFYVKDILTGDTLLTGPSDNGLYPINLRQLSSSSYRALTMTVGVKVSSSTWHCRLGHPSMDILHRVISNFSLPVSDSINKKTVCVSCQLGKSRQLPFSDSSRESTAPLELIHSDVWSNSTPSLSGCRYYVIFIDDFTRFCWVFPISNKSDVYSTFVKFKLLVEKQFNSTIRQFQSDNGGEYCSTLFKQFFSDNGIFHRLSCPHTSQQNGLAERKHRHIMDMGLTLLAQSGLSKKFWVDTF